VRQLTTTSDKSGICRSQAGSFVNFETQMDAYARGWESLKELSSRAQAGKID